ncbi:MAG: lysylphosphatidylglycerol synthase transmembrane domain-containing protein [Acidobacteria bacterium]|nr:lysylphosphatidylglycerol synthase transmembrane domain-containing protein [Acidobacteriota bacterium]
MRKRTVLVSVLAVALMGWFLRGTDLEDVWTQVRAARLDLLVVGFVLVVVTFVIRAHRWQYLLRPIGPTRFRTAFRTTVIGAAALAVLPARAGDVLRPYLLARQEGLSTSATLATIVMERVLDLIAMLALLALYVWGTADPSRLPVPLRHAIEASAGLASGVALLLVALTWVMATHPERIGRMVFGAASVFSHRIAERLAGYATTFSSGFAVAREPQALAMALFWSFSLWVVIAGEAWLIALAFGICMPFAGSFLLQALLTIGVAVPTPGGVGSYHEAYRVGVTTFFGAANDAAVAAAIVTHVISYVPVVLAGAVFMAQDGIGFGGLPRLSPTPQEKEIPSGP